MIYVYLFSLVLGGVLVGASLLLGHHETGAGLEGGILSDAGDVPGAAGSIEGALVSFMTVRFWTFFLAFFGLTGLVLDGFALVSSGVLAAVLSIGMGLFAGGGASWAMSLARGGDTQSAATVKDYVGKSARVLVGFGPGTTGKVRMEIRGNSIDLLATSVDDASFAVRDEALVVDVDGNGVRVARMEPDRASRT